MKLFCKLLLSLFLLTSGLLSAQAPPPPGSANPSPLGGVALLAAAGAAYGAKKAYDRQRPPDS